jgi:hypothetical protein
MRRLSPPLVLSVIAVVLALGGTAVASRYLITSTKQIKPSVRAKLKGNRGTQGAQGAQGVQGPQGVPGTSGVLGLVAIDSPEVSIPAGSTSYSADPTSLRAQCPSGTTVVGTGADTGIGNLDLLKKYGTFVGGFVHNDTSITIQASVQAICARLAPGAAETRSAASGRDDFEREVKALAEAR